MSGATFRVCLCCGRAAVWPREPDAEAVSGLTSGRTGRGCCVGSPSRAGWGQKGGSFPCVGGGQRRVLAGGSCEVQSLSCARQPCGHSQSLWTRSLPGRSWAHPPSAQRWWPFRAVGLCGAVCLGGLASWLGFPLGEFVVERVAGSADPKIAFSARMRPGSPWHAVPGQAAGRGSSALPLLCPGHIPATCPPLGSPSTFLQARPGLLVGLSEPGRTTSGGGEPVCCQRG